MTNEVRGLPKAEAEVDPRAELISAIGDMIEPHTNPTAAEAIASEIVDALSGKFCNCNHVPCCHNKARRFGEIVLWENRNG